MTARGTAGTAGVDAGPVPAGNSGLHVHGLRVRAPHRAGKLLLDGVAFTAPAGQVTALLGPNGAGKSTLLRAIAAAPRPESGSVAFRGDDLHALHRRERARRVALVEQDAQTDLPLAVRAVVRLGRYPHESGVGGGDADGTAVVERAMQRAGALSLADRDFPTLSGGERQRVLLARALAQQPQLLLLDEPTNHLDVAAQLDMLEVLHGLAADGVTIVAALHELSLAASHADTVVVLRDGGVVASGPTDSTLTEQLVRDVYRVDARWVEHPLTGRRLLATAPLSDRSR